MGHVSDFNGLNTREETGLSQTTSDFMSTDSILDSPLNENFMPIYNSFPDDIYQQPHLYASSNLTSFMNNDDDRNEYLDERLELDLLFDSNFIDFDPPETIQQNESSVANNDANRLNNEGNENARNDHSVNVNQDAIPEDQSKQRTSVTEVLSPNSEEINFDSQESHENIDNFDSAQTSDLETYTDEQLFKDSESNDQKNESIPKLIIKLKTEPPDFSFAGVSSPFTIADKGKSESPCADADFSFVGVSSPFTIADKVKLSKRRNGKCDEAGKTKVKDPSKHKSHKKKSRHKKRDGKHGSKKATPEGIKNFNGILPNCSVVDSAGEKVFFNQNVHVNNNINDSKIPKIKNGVNGQASSGSSLKKSSSSVNKDFYSCDNVNTHNDFKLESLNNVVKNELDEQSPLADAVDFQFEFENTNAFSMSPSDDDHNDKKDTNTSVNDFSPDVTTAIDYENIPDSNNSLSEEDQPVENQKPFSNGIGKQDFYSETKVEDNLADNEANKSSSASELIEELKAHHQQVFEEIEISTPDLELELHNAKNSTVKSSVASHSSQNSANAETSPNKTVTGCGENDMNSSNHLSANKISSLTSPAGSTFSSIASNRGGATQPRNISSSSSSVTGKSSTSHRSYRKRRRSDSSSSSSSDREKFYNRPVKYDPITQTYCDEFGREIRGNKLKYYLNSKASRHDSHSNNGSSSSSRSKSPRYRSRHQKYRKSRSSSRSHRRQRHSSSRSRSRSHGRRYKDEGDRKYRSPSPKHRGKRHYLDVEENMRAYEERRVMYVGDIPPDYTVDQLKERFGRFGPIQTASIKSKFTADGSLYIFGFVTFRNRSDVCQAIERGNENPSWPRFDLNFGGRRRFCNGNYTDLDGKVAEAESGWYGHQTSYRKPPQEDDFAELLRQEQRRLGMSKK